MITKHGHTSVGLVGMQWFMQVLTDIGHPEVAYTVATQTDPSELGLHGVQRGHDELGALGYRHPGRGHERREPEDSLGKL